jgi:YHS domain-containing protein
MVKDPVCKMEVDDKTAKFSTTYKNKTYYFCSESCKNRFDTTVDSLKSASGGICFGVRIEEEKRAME